MITYRSVWRRPFKDRRTGPAREIFEAVRNDMVDFGSPSDDVTLVVIKRL